MVDQRVATRLSGRQAARIGALFAIAIVLGAACGCSKRDKALSAIKSEYTGGNYEAAVTLCERAVRDDVADAEVFCYYGLALLSLDRDVEAFDRLGKAASMNGALSAEISGRLVAKANESMTRGKVPQAARRARTAVGLDAAADVGPLKYLVADSFFDNKRWREAARYYNEALAEYPDTSAAEKGYLNLASCYAAGGDSASAIEVLEKQLAEFPRGAVASQGEWNLVNLLYDRARSEFQRGDYNGAAVLAERIIGRSENGVAAQRARFLLGESYERMGDYAAAYDQYQTIIQEDRGASGRLVERARAKITALREAGLR